MELQDRPPPFSYQSRAWYGAPISDFRASAPELIFGILAANREFTLLSTQKDAWTYQISFLKDELIGLEGSIFLEFNIPRMGRRIDAVLLIGGLIFVVEFKVGEGSTDRSAIDQVWDYALDLKNFHEESHSSPIVPVLIVTGAKAQRHINLQADEDLVYRPVCIGSKGLRDVIRLALTNAPSRAINQLRWATSAYKPTPTIVEAARAMYARHSVESIARNDAGARNLNVTSRRIEEIVEEAQKYQRKYICFVTGVPGAGKTLVGLNIATQHRESTEPTYAVFLSGNGPLVAVLCEALTRDEVSRRKALGESVRKGQVGESVKAFIQNVHHFRDDALSHPDAPAEHVVVFDEAQRAWNLQQTASFMQRKKNRSGFDQSEPEFLISCMDRHRDWAVIICLIGGGQEINVGEAGIAAWLQAVDTKFPEWQMFISTELKDSEYAATAALDVMRRPHTVHSDSRLHLSVPMRSFRSESVSDFVKALLDCEKVSARSAFSRLKGKYPIAITRELRVAKEWIKTRARGTERYGLVASSKAQRLKPHAVDIRVKVDPIHWFLNDRDDTRSSYYLEDAATEFQVQGLELDWVCVTWDGDLRFNSADWTFHDFRGSRWQNIKNKENQQYLQNAYRVLLTRARQGMVIFVPQGEVSDPTRSPAFYDRTYDYLLELGIPAI